MTSQTTKQQLKIIGQTFEPWFVRNDVPSIGATQEVCRDLLGSLAHLGHDLPDEKHYLYLLAEEMLEGELYFCRASRSDAQWLFTSLWYVGKWAADQIRADKIRPDLARLAYAIIDTLHKRSKEQ